MSALAPPTFSPVGDSTVLPVRYAGADRYATSAAVAKSWSPGVGTVFVVGGTQFPDAVVASARAGSLGSPVLLTRQRALPGPTVTALERLRPENIVVIGQERTVSSAVIRELESHATTGRVKRVAGVDRYATSAAVSQLYPANPDTVYLASGEDYPDALAGAALAGSLKAPLLLTDKGRLNAHTRRELVRLAPKRIVVLGGPGAVSPAVIDAITPLTAGPIKRLSGQNRYATAAAVAAEFSAPSTPAYVASGRNYPDALVGAAAAARDGVPILLTPPDSVHPSTHRALIAQQPRAMFALGGSGVISGATLAELGTYLVKGEVMENFTALTSTAPFEWDGQQWSAKEAASAGPGPNRWHRSGVELGDQGSMKLRVDKNSAGQWEAAEVVREGPTGYGTYTFRTSTSVLPPSERTVLGLFTYQHLSPGEGHEEIDIEYSAWAKPGTGPGSISVHKPDPAWTREFPMTYTGPLTHTFLWAPGYVRWQIVRDDTGETLHERELWGADVPQFIDARMRMNVWLIDGAPSINQKPFEVVFSSARWTRLPSGFAAPPALRSPRASADVQDTFNSTLSTATWPGARRYGVPGLSAQRLAIPMGPGYHGIASDPDYALANSSISVEHLRPQKLDSQSESEVAYVRDEGHSVHLFILGSDTGRARIRTAGVDRNVDFSYDPSTDRWLRIRHDRSRLHFESSPDGRTWTAAVSSQPAPSWVAGATGQIKLGGGNWQSTDPAGSVYFDNLNR